MMQAGAVKVALAYELLTATMVKTGSFRKQYEIEEGLKERFEVREGVPMLGGVIADRIPRWSQCNS